MEFRKVLALRGPNIWALSPVLEAWVDLKELKDSPSNTLPGFVDRLLAWLPTLHEHECSRERPGGFVERLREGTWPGHILEHVTLELQSLAGTPVGYGRARETSEDGVYRVVIKYREEAVGRACLEAGRELVLAAIYDRPYDMQAEVRRLRELVHRACLGPSTGSIVNAARARGIPVRRLNENSLVQLGHASRQRRIVAAETDSTGAIAESIAQDKELTKMFLRSVGVPVPEGRPVESAEDAWEAAQEIGTPVVVKPRDGNQGRGVATDLSTREQVMRAYEAAAQEEDDVVVEKFAPGADHRVLVVGGRVVAAARREPAQVVGDGRSTIAQLIEEVNRDPRRSDWHATALSRMYLDAVSLGVLAEQGYTADSVPEAGVRVLIRRNANLSTGGTAVDVTDRVHPDVAAHAVAAAQVVGLDIAGVDVVARDIGRPLEEQGGVIVEVNAGPGLRMHLEPSEGTPRPVGEAIVDLLFPDGQDGRIPVVAITGVNGKTTTTRLVAHVLQASGKTVGMTCTDGIYLGGRCIERGDCAGPKSARAVLLSPKVEAAVFETARGGILREGLGFDRCQVGVVTNIGQGDHLGQGEVHTLEQLAYVKQTVVDVVLPTGYAVLKADEPLVAEMAKACRGGVIFFGRDEHHPVIAAHRAGGGRAVYDRDGMIWLAEGPREEPLVALGRVPLTHGGRVSFQVENALAAAASCWGVGLSRDAIRRGLETFRGDDRHAPGRFNVLEGGGATVVVDYGHNPSAIEALVEAFDRFPHHYRTAVFSAAGDRLDEAIVRQGEIIGEAFDRVLLYEEAEWRYHRADGELVTLLRRGVSSGTRATDVADALGERDAVAAALAALRVGELLYIQPSDIAATLATVRRHLDTLPAPSPADVEVLDAPAGVHGGEPVYAAYPPQEGHVALRP
jgi:cyanophycin synthetase